MIKDVMVRLDGTSGDDVLLAAVSQIAVDRGVMKY